MHELTLGGAKLKVYLEREVNGVTLSGTAIYSDFEIGDLSTYYTLLTANYQGYEGENGNLFNFYNFEKLEVV